MMFPFIIEFAGALGLEALLLTFLQFYPWAHGRNTISRPENGRISHLFWGQTKKKGGKSGEKHKTLSLLFLLSYRC